MKRININKAIREIEEDKNISTFPMCCLESADYRHGYVKAMTKAIQIIKDNIKETNDKRSRKI